MLYNSKCTEYDKAAYLVAGRDDRNRRLREQAVHNLTRLRGKEDYLSNM